MASQTGLTRNELVEAFRALGLATGDSVVVHSSCRSLGPVEGGADTVLDALIETIGPGGNLMLPTFNYTRPLPEPCYDPDTTPARTGIIPQLGRRRSGAVRSLHPTHSVAVIGPQAEALTRDHLAVRTLGKGSPLDRLAAAGGKVLLIGVGYTSNSLIHVAEEHADIPKASWHDPLPLLKVRLPTGQVVEHRLDTSPSCSAAFGGAEYALRRHGEIRDSRVGAGKLHLMRAQDVVQRVVEMIREKPDILLCTWVGCRPCTEARKTLKKEGRTR